MSNIRDFGTLINQEYYDKLNLDFSELIGKKWPGFHDECRDLVIKYVSVGEFSRNHATFEKSCNDVLFKAAHTHAIGVMFDGEDPISKNDHVVLQVVDQKVYKYSYGNMCYFLIDLFIEEKDGRLYLALKKQGE